MLVMQARFNLPYQNQDEGIQLRCPRCFGPLGYLQDEDCTPHDCPACRSRLGCEQGIWKALLPERAARYSRFVENYESIQGSGRSRQYELRLLPCASLSRSLWPS